LRNRIGNTCPCIIVGESASACTVPVQLAQAGGQAEGGKEVTLVFLGSCYEPIDALSKSRAWLISKPSSRMRYGSLAARDRVRGKATKPKLLLFVECGVCDCAPSARVPAVEDNQAWEIYKLGRRMGVESYRLGRRGGGSYAASFNVGISGAGEPRWLCGSVATWLYKSMALQLCGSKAPLAAARDKGRSP
jgi:hypothetical protein